MPIVIKEIRVNTVVEKKVAPPDEISEQVCLRLREQILEELSLRNPGRDDRRGRRER